MTYLLGIEDEPIGKDENAINFQVNKVGGKPVIYPYIFPP